MSAMDRFNPLKVPLASCPNDSALVGVLHYPSVSFIYILLGITSLFFAIYTAVKFNTVIVFNQPVRKPPISNTWWVAYFVVISLRATIDATKFAVISISNLTLDSILIVVSLFLYGIATLALTLALNHQRKHRSNFVTLVPEDSSGFPTNSHLEFGVSSSSPSSFSVNEEGSSLFVIVRKNIFGPAMPFILLLLLYCLALCCEFSVRNTSIESTFYCAFMAMYCLQRIPVLILVIWIILVVPRTKVEGPSPISKLILLLAILLDCANNLPVTIWAVIINDRQCILFIFSSVDIIHLLYCFAQVLFFIFLRSEFIRNKEQFVFSTIQTHKEYEQYGIDWKQFNTDPRNSYSQIQNPGSHGSR